uniref:Uncharacterized protein n=1 Tax=uncultured marine group II/III euryarchaeote AD1000_87_A06 TaxID=1457817 RepID=A0A075G4L0_9EURY|nr:hypothetical protein [uncultured marine group II/III euryarchaeote AD1000_87_A06]
MVKRHNETTRARQGSFYNTTHRVQLIEILTYHSNTLAIHPSIVLPPNECDYVDWRFSCIGHFNFERSVAFIFDGQRPIRPTTFFAFWCFEDFKFTVIAVVLRHDPPIFADDLFPFSSSATGCKQTGAQHHCSHQ